MSRFASLAQLTTDDLCLDDDGAPIPGCVVREFDPANPVIPSGSDFEQAFGAFFILAVLLAIGGAAWRWHFATKMAERRGIDRTEAGLMGMLDERGLAATYVQPAREKPRLSPRPASRPIPAAAPPPMPKTAEPETTSDVFPAGPSADAASAPVTGNEAPSDAVDDIEVRLARLADLEARGVISADEATKRRSEILDEI